MKGKDFLKSKWMEEAKKPETAMKIKNGFSGWATKANNSELVRRAKQLYGFFLSDQITGLQKTLVIAGLLYVITPVDIMPDFIPVIGWLDDIGVTSFILSYILSACDKAEELKKLHDLNNDDVANFSGSTDELLEDEIIHTNKEYNE